ncbi:MAG: septum formation protein Maf [Elusimicrobia bacterium RIFCSPHIGHO2_02_FULL_57_9]|nr:MAG: septum formation protein Maf [Elusimicrobia bacterium RIFCSPHIGHO2_02_FULL_57_9]
MVASPTLILASASPQRRTLLKKLGVAFRIIPSRVSEKSREKNPLRLARELARRKALAVARKYADAAVLGADTIVVCGGEIIGKPRSKKEARSILEKLNGRWHKVYTGVALAREGGKIIFDAVALSRVKAHKLPSAALAALAGKHMDKAGAYAVQDKKDPFISRIEGELDNVIGLPLKAVRKLLR